MNEDKETECSNCKTTITPLWRRGINGTYLCNACGLYYKIHQSNRPIELKTDTFKHRQRLRRSNGHIYHTYKYDKDGFRMLDSYDPDEIIDTNTKSNNTIKEDFKFHDYYEKLDKSKHKQEANKKKFRNTNINYNRSPFNATEMKEIDMNDNEIKNNTKNKNSKDKEKEKASVLEGYENLDDLEKIAVMALISLNKQK